MIAPLALARNGEWGIIYLKDTVKPGIRELLSFTLQDEGYQAGQASDGRHALELIAQQEPNIILLDIRMSGVGGRQFARLYRE